MKKILRPTLIVLTLFVFSGVYGADARIAALKEQAELIGRVMLDKNFENLPKYTHPKLVQMSGGEAQMLRGVRTAVQQMEQQGMKFLSTEIGEPSKISETSGKEIISLVPQSAVMSYQGQKVKSDSHLLGVSSDNGQNWVFIDLSNLNGTQFKALFPELADYFKFPSKKDPYMID